ncbi:MAG: hypothetical protein HY721_18475, partial [Planctomycetes bacterium]|nr:hypothetical protein [Planctomycetota bacterium]
TGGSGAVTTTVNLFASDEDGLVMPQTVAVPAGQTTVEFPISASPPGGKMVTIFAAANGATVIADLSIRPNGPMKGFINDDNRRDISDAVFLLNFLFSGGAPPAFPAFADVNGSGKVDISDAVAILVFLFSDAEVPTLCTSDPATLPSGLRLVQELVTDGDEVCISGNFPAATYRIVLKGFSFPNGRLISGNQVVGERKLIFCTCRPAVRSPNPGPDGEPGFKVCFNVPLEAPSGEYEVFVLPASGDCPAGNAAGTGCLEDDCAIGPMKLFVQASHIVSILEDFIINDNSEPSGDHPAELFFTFASQTGEPDSAERFPVQFADSYPGGRPGSQHLTNVDDTIFRADVPVFSGREADMELTECQEEWLSDPDPARCAAACAEAARRMNNNLTVTVGGAEFDCLDNCGSVWDEVAGVGVAAIGCLAAFKFGGVKGGIAGCGAAVALGDIVDTKLEDALEDEDDVLGVAEINFSRGSRPFWSAGATAPPAGLSKSDIDLQVFNHRLPAFRVVDARLSLKSVTLIEADDEPCFAPDELFFETRASLGLNGRLGESTRFPSTSGLAVAEGATQDLSSSNFSLSAGSNADSSFLYVEIGVWDFDGEDEAELIGLHSQSHFLGDLLEAGADFVEEGHERRRVSGITNATVSGWNSGERCDCSGFQACAFSPNLPHGIAEISYEIEVIWEKYPQ